MEDILQEIKDTLIEQGDLYSLMREINSYNGALDDLDYWENGEDFFRTFYEDDIDGAVRAVCYGEYNYTDEYVIINAYGNLDSISEFDLQNLLEESIDEIVDALVDIWGESNDFDLPAGVAELLDKYTGGDLEDEHKKQEENETLKLSDKMKEINIKKPDDDIDGNKVVDVKGKYGNMKSIKVDRDKLTITPSIARQTNKKQEAIEDDEEENDIIYSPVYVDQKETLSDGSYHMRLSSDGHKVWINVEPYKGNGVVKWDYDFDSIKSDRNKEDEDFINTSVDVNDIEEAILEAILDKKQEISEGLEINKPQNKPVQAVEVTFKDKSMLFKTNQVNSVFVDARKFMIPFANELNLEVEDIKDINVNVIYEDGEKSSVRIKPFDYQDTAYERYKAFGGTEVFGQFQDWYSFNGYDEYGNKVRRRKNSKLNGYANDGSQKRLSVENKKQEAVDDEEEDDIDFDDTISLLDIALSEIPTVGVEDWGKDDELLFIADTKVMFENLKDYEEEIPKYYYDNASNDDWSNGIDSYLDEIKGVDLNSGDSDNTYNWNAPLTHAVEFTIYEADDGCYFKGSIHRAGDVRGNYTTEFLLKFNDKDDCLEALFDSCAGFCQREVKLENTTYVITPHFFNEYVDIYNLDTDEAYDDVYCDCIDRLKEIIAENKQDEKVDENFKGKKEEVSSGYAEFLYNQQKYNNFKNEQDEIKRAQKITMLQDKIDHRKDSLAKLGLRYFEDDNVHKIFTLSDNKLYDKCTINESDVLEKLNKIDAFLSEIINKRKSEGTTE